MKLVPIGDIVTDISNWQPSVQAPDNPFSYIDIASVDKDQKAIVHPSTMLGIDAPSRARQLLQTNDVIVSTVRPNLNSAAVVPASLDGATASTGFCVLRCNPAKINHRYLFRWITSPTFVLEMSRVATGASYPAVSDGNIKGSKIPLPPLPEQRRIAAILDHADDLRAKRRAAIAKLDSLAESIFLDMFGDPATNPRSWRLQPLGQLALRFSDGPFGSNLKSEHYTETGIRVIRLQNIGIRRFVNDDAAYVSPSHFESLARHKCIPGDVLIGTLGDPNLRACIQPAGINLALNKADCVQMRVNTQLANAEYVCTLLNVPSTAKHAQSLIQGQTRLRISMGRLRDFEVPCPPIKDQMHFKVRLDAIDRMLQATCSIGHKLDEFLASLRNRAFRGDL